MSKDLRERTRTKQLILQELVEVAELWPTINMAQHICTILRPITGAYFWTDEELLKKIETYRDELENDDDE